jgi:hypothetical protein
MFFPYGNYGSQQLQTLNLIRVNNLEEAKSYQIPPNSTVALFDANEDIMYIKSSDCSGFTNIRTFSFVEVPSEQVKTSTTSNYITKDDLLNFKMEVADYVQQLIREEKTGQTRTNGRSKGPNKEP